MTEIMEPLQQQKTAGYFSVAPGVWGTHDIFVNLYYVQNPADNTWVLVDAGLKTSYHKIRKAAAALFGPDSKPSAIILTHGHFDHTGALPKLLNDWQVPVYAHYLELPYLTGRASYPPPDTTVGGGAMSSLAWMFPKKPIDLGGAINVLPEDHTIPGLEGWKWLHTPGHSPGHVSLYRQDDKTLIAGDAFCTTKSESAFSSLTQKETLCGPPKYFTSDWVSAEQSVRKLAVINPNNACCGHGKPMYGDELHERLRELADNFTKMAVPAHGRYVDNPAVADANGVLYVPEDVSHLEQKLSLLVAFCLLIGGLAYLFSRKRGRTKTVFLRITE